MVFLHLKMINCHFKVARIKGEFIWHEYPETYAVFFMIGGAMRIDFCAKTLNTGNTLEKHTQTEVLWI